MPFLFDTGSSGFWVYPMAIKTYRSTAYTETNTYDSGIVYSGTIVYATVDFGNGLVTGNIPVIRVDSATCSSERPDCPAEPNAKHCPNVNPKRKDAGIYCLVEGRKLYGTFGADLEPKIVRSHHKAAFELYNAIFGLAQPWANAFIVTPTSLLIGPRSTLGFTTFAMTPLSVPSPLPNGVRGWKRDVTLCYTVGTSLKNRCWDTVFDTGASNVDFMANVSLPRNAKRCSYVRKGTPLTLSRPNGSTVAAFAAGYTSNWNAIIVTSPKPSATPQVNTGLTFYNRDEVLFDAKHGRTGLRALSSPGNLGRGTCT